MKIRYLGNGIDDIVEDEVLAEGDHHFFVPGAIVGVLRAVPRELVTSEYHANSEDYPPPILLFIQENRNEIEDIDFGLADLFKVSH